MAKKQAPPKRGRPPVNPPNMTERFMVRVTPETKAAWEALAAADGRSLSDWSRRAIVAGLGKLPAP